MVHHLDFGMHVRSIIVQVLSITEAYAVLADSSGSVDALVLHSALDTMERGSFVSVAGRVIALSGRLFLLVEGAKPHSGLPYGYTSVRLGQKSLSQRVCRYGCLVLRGTKCVLARQRRQVQLPVAEAFGYETKQQAATRALTDNCKIYAEEVTLLRDVAPVVSYDKSGDNVCVLMLFAAVAASPPPGSGGCDGGGCCEATAENDPYGWYNFEQAIGMLATECERSAVMKLTLAIAEAVSAGIVTMDTPCAFRPTLAAINNDLSLNQVMALMPPESFASPPAILLGEQLKRAIRSKKKSCCGSGKCGKRGCC